MKVTNPEKRLSMFYGRVDEKHIRSLLPYIKGKNVLDIGCGNGSTTDYIQKNLEDIKCIGIDDSQEEIDKANTLFPGNDFRVENAEKLGFEDGLFQTIVLRDALHHLYEEADYTKIKNELQRIASKDSRLIILDPNINFILKMARRLASHKDAECDFNTAIQLTRDLGFKITTIQFHTIYSLPLSGGYVGYNFVPNWKPLYGFILFTEKILEKIVSFLGLRKFFCWRYLIVAERQ